MALSLNRKLLLILIFLYVTIDISLMLILILFSSFCTFIKFIQMIKHLISFQLFNIKIQQTFFSCFFVDHSMYQLFMVKFSQDFFVLINLMQTIRYSFDQVLRQNLLYFSLFSFLIEKKELNFKYFNCFISHTTHSKMCQVQLELQYFCLLLKINYNFFEILICSFTLINLVESFGIFDYAYYSNPLIFFIFNYFSYKQGQTFIDLLHIQLLIYFYFIQFFNIKIHSYKMINVHSFQKMTPHQEQPSSKTSHFTFGQNYKKIIANSKASFDFRKFLQKTTAQKRMTAHNIKQERPRTPLQQIGDSSQNNFRNKAFKIRCYTKKAKQNQTQVRPTSKIQKYRSKCYDEKPKKQQVQTKNSTIPQAQTIFMNKIESNHKIEPLSNNIKVIYNPSLFRYQLQKKYSSALILDVCYLISKIKNSASKINEKQRQKAYFRKKMAFIVKSLIDDAISQQTQKQMQQVQIIFKVNSDEQMLQLHQQLESCQFSQYYAIFNIQRKSYQSLNIYHLGKIQNLSSNIIIVDQANNFNSIIPIFQQEKFISYISFADKINFVNSLQALFNSVSKLSIIDNQNTDQLDLQFFQFPQKQIQERLRQKNSSKAYRRQMKTKRNRCQSSYQDVKTFNFTNKDQKSVQLFKQKILKYLKIVKLQNFIAQKSKNYTNNVKCDQFDCLHGRDQNCKTHYQIVSELLRLNNHIRNQILNYSKQIQIKNFSVVNRQQSREQVQINFPKMALNIFH